MDQPDLEKLDRTLRDSEERLRRMDGLDETLKAVTASFATPDGLVSIELGLDGVPRELYIDPRAMRLQSAALAELILSAYTGAHAQLQTQVSEAMSEVLGEDATPSAVLADAEALQGTMTSMLADVTKQMNDAILQVNRLSQRRAR
jgi:DNA-binding protein YbaB